MDFSLGNISTNITEQKYGRFRTPFFQVEVGPPDGKKMTPLPAQIAKLIEKIEIQDTVTSNTCFHSQITITFIEGSREPYATDDTNTSILYSLGTNSLDVLTNKSGLLPDLIFSEGNAGLGITTLLSATTQLSGAAKNLTSTLSGDVSIDIEKSGSSNNVKFLFKENNQIKVTWGYAEGDKRSVRGRIRMVQTDFPENGQPRTTIVCLDPSAHAVQLATPKGLKFSQKIPAGISKTGVPVFNYLDKTTNQILQEICTANGVKVIISNNLLAPLMDKNSSKLWVGGESFYEFLKKLASRHDAYFGFLIDPSSGNDVLYFVTKVDYDSFISVSDINLFSYKQPGSILKNVSIKVDFGSITGSYAAGYDDKGELVQKGHEDPKSQVPLFSNSGLVDTDPESGIAGAIKAVVPGGKAIGSMQISPEANTPGNVEAKALGKASCASDRLIQIEFTSLGFPLLFTGSLFIGNIGNRYSGIYQIQTVIHTIDTSGYILKGIGIGRALSQGGITLPDAPSINAPKDSQSPIKLFGTSSPIEELNTIRATV